MPFLIRFSLSRQGQKKKLVVIRLIMENTLEHAFYNRNIAPTATSAAASRELSVLRANSMLAQAGAHPIMPRSDPKASSDDDKIKSLDMDE